MAAEEKVNILLVDDQPGGLIALEAMLEQLGQNLVRASSGREALRHLLAMDFAVILLDVQMPTMDGFETAGLIRLRDRSRHTPIIFLTAGQKTEAQVFRGYAVGAVDYLLKPIDPEILRSKVRVFVDLARKTDLIKQQAEELSAREQEARRLLEEIERKHRALEGANRELEAFSYSVSHDLRAPLRTIDGFSQALVDDLGPKLDADNRKHLMYVREAAQRMGELIDGLLSLSRVSRAEIRREPIDLTALANEVVVRLRAAQPDRQVEITVEPGLLADGDGRLLTVVMENLLGNAWKFTGQKPTASITFGKVVKDALRPVFYVRDDGAGFDMSYAHKLFGPFQRLHSYKEFEGHGVGLATVQRIVHRHGGRIWAEADVGRGATFFFTLMSEDGDRQDSELPIRTSDLPKAPAEQAQEST